MIASSLQQPSRNVRRMTVPLRSHWDELANVHRRTAGFLSEQQLPDDVIDAVAMVATELCENGIKYGAPRDDRDGVLLAVAVDASEITVEVKNRVGKTSQEDLTRLDRVVQWIRGFQDPFEAYLARLKELSTDALDCTDSRLGLVRIAYEGQSVLDFYVNEHDVLAVSAIRRL